jgi:RimJ/RimL family protein N-acetyltransferase
MDPRQYRAEAGLRDGAPVLIRAISPLDRDAMRQGFDRLSERSIYHRFFQSKRELTDAELIYLTELDFHDHVALVAVIPDGTERGQLIGVGRFVRGELQDRAEVAFVVGDDFQGRGVGTLLLEHLARIARTIGISAFEADVLPDNTPMLEVFQHSGLAEEERAREGVVHVRLEI